MPKPSYYIKRGWCQGTLARDTQGEACLETSPDAIAWCTYGAIYAAYPNEPQHRESLLDKLQVLFHIPLAKWNDDPKRTQAEVIALLQSIGE